MKNLKKRLTSVCLVIALLAVMIPTAVIPASAATTTRCGITADWTAKSTNGFPTSGYYYLTADITAPSGYSIDGTLYLDLNGHTIDFTKTGDFVHAIKVEDNDSFYLYDSVGTGKLQRHYGSAYYRAIYIKGSNAKFYMYGGSISGFANYQQHGGAVSVINGRFEMRGGTIMSSNGENGGAVNVSSGSAFYMYGGTIKDTTGKYGAAVYTGGTFYMDGGTITNCTASVQGGGVYIAGGSFTMKSGTISYCEARASDNKSGIGGGVSVNNGTFTMDGGYIQYNSASDSAGGVGVGGNATFTMNGGWIEYNKRDGLIWNDWLGGGGVHVSGTAEFYMYGGYIYDNTSNVHGGGVFINDGPTFYMYGGTIYDNECTNTRDGCGGGVALRYGNKTAYFNFNGGEIRSNTAAYGGGVYNNGANFSMNGDGYLGSNSVYNKGTGVYENPGSHTYTRGRIYTGATFTNKGTVVAYSSLGATKTTTSAITFDAKGGSGGTTSMTATWSSTPSSISVPTRTGYTFNGYYNATSGGDMYFKADGGAYRTWDYVGSRTLYAQWTPITYTIAYDTNGGEGTYTNISAKYDTSYTLSATEPTKTGYTFAGWNTAADGTGTTYTAEQQVSNLSATNNATVTLYAQWTEHTATLTYDNNDHGTAPEAVTMKYSQATNAAEAITGVTGYTFKGWNTQADGKGTAYAAGEQIKAANADPAATTLYAQWSQNQLLIYDANGHGEAPQSQVMTFAEAAKTAAAIGSVTGYTFKEWNTAANGSGTSYKPGDEIKVKDTDPEGITLYAQWTANGYQVTLNYNEGTGESLTGYTYAEGADLPEPTKDGYAFLGWYENEYFTGNPVTAIGKTDTGDKTFYARWAALQYEYILDKDNKDDAPAIGKEGKYIKTTYYMDGDTRKVVGNSTKESVTFEKWYLRTMVQYRTGDEGGLDVRFVSMLDHNLGAYKEAGFIFKVGEAQEEITVSTTEGKKSYLADGNKTYDIKDFSTEDDYFFLANTEFTSEVVEDDPVITVRPYVMLMDGTTVIEGDEISFMLLDLHQ